MIEMLAQSLSVDMKAKETFSSKSFSLLLNMSLSVSPIHLSCRGTIIETFHFSLPLNESPYH